MNRKSNIFQRILYKSAGVDLEVIEKCPDIEKQKYAGIGAIVINTALLSAIAGFYAIQLIIGNAVLSVFIGGVFGLMIGFINRLTFSTFTTRYSKWDQILQIIPKLIFALLIALILVKPLELKIFEKEIISQIQTSTVIENENSLFSRIIAFEELKSKEKYFFHISYFLTLLMILLQVTPIFIKLMSSKGSYEALIEQRDYFLHEIEAQSFTIENQLINRVSIAQNKILTDTALWLNLSTFEKIKNYILRDDLKAAINELFYILEQNNLESEEKELLILASQVKQLRNQITHGTIDSDFSSRELNRLREKILSLTINLEKRVNFKLPSAEKTDVSIKNEMK